VFGEEFQLAGREDFLNFSIFNLLQLMAREPKQLENFLKLIRVWRGISTCWWRGFCEFHHIRSYTAHTDQTKLVGKLLEVDSSLEETLKVQVERIF